MQVPFFNGGLNQRLDPSLIQINEAVEYSNIDNTTGTLHSDKGFTKLLDDASGYIYRFDDQVISSVASRDYVEYNNGLFWTEENGQPSKFGVNTFNLGIEAPAPIPAIDEDGFPIFNDNYQQVVGLYVEFEDFEEGDFFDFSNTLSGDLGAGTYDYRLFIYEDAKLIYYFDKEVTVPSASAVRFTLKTKHNVKLAKEDGGSYKLIAEGDSGTLTDNGQTVGAVVPSVITTDTRTTQWTYTYYNETDGTESAPAPLTEEMEVPLFKKVKLSNFTISSDLQVSNMYVYRLNTGITEPSLVLIIDNSDTFTYEYTPTLDVGPLLDSYNNLPAPFGIKYLTEAYGIFFAAQGNKLLWSELGNANYWPAANGITFGFDITGILPIYTGILIFGINRTDLLVGNSTDTFARETISKTTGCKLHKSCKLINFVPAWISNDGICTISNGTINVLSRDKLGKVNIEAINSTVHDDTYWVLKSNRTILAMDTRFGGIVFKEYYVDALMSDLIEYRNNLYSSVEGKLVSLFTGKPLPLHYKSPAFNDGSSSMTKLYNNVYIQYKGDFKVKVLIDDVVVIEKTLDPYNNGIPADLKVPEANQRGTTIQFDIYGTGVIKEIEYKPMERVNGR